MENIGDRIKRLRQQKNISQRQFAKLVGSSPGLISFIERNMNKPNYMVIGRIARVLGTSCDYLIFGTESSGESTDDLIKRLKRELGTETPEKGYTLSTKEKELVEKYNILSRLSRLSRVNLDIVLDVIKRVESL